MIIASLLALSTAAMADGTRGIGQYPGAPSEFFGPTIVWSESGQLTNVALHRMAFASSTYDYNHTAHLATDGLVGNEPPAILRASTPSGPLPRHEAEWAIDGGKFSRNILYGSHTWLRYDWDGATAAFSPRRLKLQGMVAYDEKLATHGYRLTCQVSADGQQWQTIGEQNGEGLPGELLHYKLHSDPNKQEAQDLLPARVLQETITLSSPTDVRHFRLLLDMEGAAHWDLRELTFADTTDTDLDVLPSRQFSSMWLSGEGGEQWLYTDLGRSLPIAQVRLHWHQAPKAGSLQVSDDAKTWRTVADLKAGTPIPTAPGEHLCHGA